MSEKKKKDVPQEQPQPEKKAAEAAAAEETADVPEVEEVFTVTREQMEQFESLAKLVSDGNDKYLRLAAEYDNYRKRTAKEKETLWGDARADTAGAFLPVYDNLERALKQETADEAFKKGVEMTMNQLKEILSKLGVTEIPALGEKFDPEKHNAVMHTEDDTAEENTVVEVFQKGYTLGDKVLRFAMVKVAN